MAPRGAEPGRYNVKNVKHMRSAMNGNFKFASVGSSDRIAETAAAVGRTRQTGRSRVSALIAALLLSAAIGGVFELSAQDESEPRKEAVVIGLYPHGFEPAEITRAAGPFLLVIHDRTGLEETSIRIDRVAGPRLVTVRISNRSADWNALTDLPAGNYLITEAGHPEWSCLIAITSEQ